MEYYSDIMKNELQGRKKSGEYFKSILNYVVERVNNLKDMSLTISHLDEQKYLKGEESIRNF
jgi:hypothetical protein